MKRKEKCFGTVLTKHIPKAKELWGSDIRHQFRIVCKAKSLAEANRIAFDLGLGKNVFRRDYTCDTGNPQELALCDQFGFIIRPLDGNKDFKDIREILDFEDDKS